MLSDPRLPDPALATRRVYGDLRPHVNVTSSARIAVRASLVNKYGVTMRYTVYVNRTDKRWWFEVVTSAAGCSNYGGSLHDYATTTSQQRAQGWIDAINEATKEQRR